VSTGVRIDRCVCFDRTFAELRAVADDAGAQTLAELDAHVAFGRRCGLCRPYVERMLETRELVFSMILTGERE
jgi:bacterioferritin-associated ferredoxin